jgi:nicotinamide-nucleotide amidase
VSEPVAIEMAEGALRHSPASLALAVTGIAGPGGATASKPIGLVHLVVRLRQGGSIHVERQFGSVGREEIRKRSVAQALEMLRRLADEYRLTV